MSDRLEELRAAYDAAYAAHVATATAVREATVARDAALEVALDAWAKSVAAKRALDAAEKETNND